jgi:hypothetical protein
MYEGFTYNPDTGKFYNPLGKEIGSYTQKYGRTFHKGKTIPLARFAVYLQTGEWPKYQVDHKDRNPHNNKWDNLRICTRTENFQNKDKYVKNKSGYKGVFITSSGKFRAKIRVNNKPIHLGNYLTAPEAALAYDSAAVKYFGEYAVLNFKEIQSVV